jgi:hypothetical protein
MQQKPNAHTWLGQTFPHPPQFAASFFTSTQPVEQTEFGTGHRHEPPVQVSPGRHWSPQLPQCCESDCVSTHTPPQRAHPEGQPHVPELQVLAGTTWEQSMSIRHWPGR